MIFKVMEESVNMRNTSGRREGLDLLRFVCAAMVVCVHIGFPGHIGQAMIWICRIAVPCFFMISGFFFDPENFQLRWTLRKFFPCILAGMLCYLAKSVIFEPETLSEIFSLRSLYILVVFNHPLWAEHLWYLLAMCYTYLTASATADWQLRKWAYWAIPGMLIFNLLAGEFSHFLAGEAFPVYYSRNYLFFSLPFFLIGRLIGEKEKFLDTVGKKLVGIGIGVAGLVLSLLEYAVTRQKPDFTVGFLFMSVSVFYFAKEYNVLPCWLKKVADAGRRYTLFIYIMHPLIGYALRAAANKLAFHAYPYIATPLVFLVSLGCAIVWNKITETITVYKIVKKIRKETRGNDHG